MPLRISRATVISGLAAMAAMGIAGAQGSAGMVERVSPELDALVPKDAVVEKLAGGFKFTEGPVWTREGVLLFSDIPSDVILKWDPKTRQVSDYRRPSGNTNGNTLDARRRLISCEHTGRRVSVQGTSGHESVVDRYEGKRLNSPNDVIFSKSGAMYFTDPPYGLPGQDKDPGKELPHNGVYRWKDGKLTLLTAELTRPNGLALSPDEKTLYVANSDGARKIWMAYPVERDGTLGKGRVFFDVTESEADGLPDGMKVDGKGNLYCTGPGGVWIFNPAGKHLGTIKPTEVPANCAWGDDGKTLYMTARTGLYRIRLSVAGPLP